VQQLEAENVRLHSQVASLRAETEQLRQARATSDAKVSFHI